MSVMRLNREPNRSLLFGESFYLVRKWSDGQRRSGFVRIFKTESDRTCAGNAADHVQLIGHVAISFKRPIWAFWRGE